MYREPAIRELHTQGAKGQGVEIKYMHKAVKWNILHVQVQRTSFTVQKVCYTTLYIIAIYLNIRSIISCLRIEHYNQMLILQYSQSRVVCGILANL